MKSTTEPPGGKNPDGMKGQPNKDKAAIARDEQRERQWRSIQTWFRSVWSEMKRVTWPSREEWVSATLVTVGLVVVVALWTQAVGSLAEWIFRTGQ